jgi:hypothetical protein
MDLSPKRSNVNNDTGEETTTAGNSVPSPIRKRTNAQNHKRTPAARENAIASDRPTGLSMLNRIPYTDQWLQKSPRSPKAYQPCPRIGICNTLDVRFVKSCLHSGNMDFGRRGLLTTCAIGAITALVAVVIFLSAYGWYIRHQASSLLKEIVALNVGKSPSEDAIRIARNHRLFLVSTDCQNGSCQYQYIVGNRWLSWFRIEPESQFRVGITVDHSTVTHIGAALLRSMDIYPSFQASAGNVEEYAVMPEHLASVGHYGFAQPVGKPYLRVFLDGNASAQQRQRAFDFSFRCLTKPGGGCDLPCDYLPSAWKEWKSQIQNGGFPMSDFNHLYPNNQRCE